MNDVERMVLWSSWFVSMAVVGYVASTWWNSRHD